MLVSEMPRAVQHQARRRPVSYNRSAWKRLGYDNYKWTIRQYGIDRLEAQREEKRSKGLWPNPVLKKVRLSEPRIIAIRIGADEEGARQTDRSLHYSCSFPISAACSSIKAAIHV